MMVVTTNYLITQSNIKKKKSKRLLVYLYINSFISSGILSCFINNKASFSPIFHFSAFLMYFIFLTFDYFFEKVCETFCVILTSLSSAKIGIHIMKSLVDN